MNEKEILSIFLETNALLQGHFQLTSGLHSAKYFQCARVLQHPHHSGKLCGKIVAEFSAMKPDVVIAPALGGIVVAQEVGRQLGCRSIFAERKEGVMQLRRGFEIARGERVLVCEDVVTTGGSVQEVIDLVQTMGGDVVGVGFVVDRSSGKAKFRLDGEGRQFALLHMDVVVHQPDDCPMCKAGTPVTKPGSRSAT